ncbi:MAG: HDOD domain-containing protein [Planctomycetota bacterium]
MDRETGGKKTSSLERFLSTLGEGRLHTLPNVVIRLLDKLSEPDPDLNELADLLLSDQVLTARMLRFVNSPVFGLRRRMESVRETIAYLGLGEIQNLVYSVTVTNTFERDAPLLKRVRLWEHRFGCALFSRLVAKAVNYAKNELAYLGGLLHDIGEAIIAIHAYKDFEKVLKYATDQRTTTLVAERAVLGFDHTDIGPWMGKHWQLAAELPDVISHHHDVLRSEKDKALVAIVRVADLACLQHGVHAGPVSGEEVDRELVKL